MGTTEAAWPGWNHIFSTALPSFDCLAPDRPAADFILGPPNRLAKDFLSVHPVDVLLVLESSSSLGKKNKPVRDAPWMRSLTACSGPTRPSVVICIEESHALVADDGVSSKVVRKRMQQLGYNHTVWFLRAHELGAAVVQDKTVSIFFEATRGNTHGAPLPPTEDHLSTRPMKNLLLPFAIPPKAWFRGQVNPPLQPAAPWSITGHTSSGPVFGPSGPMPNRSGALVTLEKGTRQILPRELAKAKGLPLEWLTLPTTGPCSPLSCIPSVHILQAVGDSISAWLGPAPPTPLRVQAPPAPTQAATPPPLEQTWDWSPPDLLPSGTWYKDRLHTLRTTISGRSDFKQLYKEGKKALAIHRMNYSAAGPKQLQLLWWEFPPRYQELIRTGFPMNFLSAPSGPLEENSPMTPEGLKVAAAFTDELLDLGVLAPVPKGMKLEAVGPMFCLKKLSQDDQWRVLADMKRGGQNEHIASEPVHFVRPHDILGRLYTGGWSAVIDASKYFYNFKTKEDERGFLGCIHPITGAELWYVGLPMGAANSPAIACRVGSAILRRMALEDENFSGTVAHNTIGARLMGKAHHPDWGTGQVTLSSDGTPSGLIFAHVDDFLIHATSQLRCRLALEAVMEMTVRLGLICQPCKTSPPAQVQKYTGFLFDTRDIPCLRIPESKRQRGLATLAYLKSIQVVSRLALAVVSGILQSVVDATPQRIGNTFLRNVYDSMHANATLPPSDPDFYYSMTTVSQEAWEDLGWWTQALKTDVCAQARARDATTLSINWGDGSGTGTGGTNQWIDAKGPVAQLDMWMGVWTDQVHHFDRSSNWKELRTILLALERHSSSNALRGRLVFYFTDNMVSYHILRSGSSTSPALHSLIRDIKLLELNMGCRLEVVHVPGDVMICQGTDGLSRGLWASRDHLRLPPEEETARLFRALPFSPELLSLALTSITKHAAPIKLPLCAPPRSTAWTHVTISDSWISNDLIETSSVWTIPPDSLRQAITAAVLLWTEAPYTTEMIFIVPRLFMGEWMSVSKHVEMVCTIPCNAVPGPLGWSSDLPVVILYLPRFTPSLSPTTPRPSISSLVPASRRTWIDRQADNLRGM